MARIHQQTFKISIYYLLTFTVGKGVHTPPFLDQPPLPFSKIPSFLEIQDIPTFFRLVGKTKVLKDSFNRVVDDFYPQSILILEEYLQKW